MRRVRHLKLLTASITASITTTTLMTGLRHGFIASLLGVLSVGTEPVLAQKTKPSKPPKPSKPKAGQSSGNLSTTTTSLNTGTLIQADPVSPNAIQTQQASTDTSGFGPASLDETEASRRYGVWGGVLP